MAGRRHGAVVCTCREVSGVAGLGVRSSLAGSGATLVLLATLGFLLPLWSRIRFDSLRLPRPGIYSRLLLAAMSSQVWFRLASALIFSLFALTWLSRVEFDSLTLGLAAVLSITAIYFWVTAYASHRKGLEPWLAYGNYVTGQFEGQLMVRLRLGYLLMLLCSAFLALIRLSWSLSCSLSRLLDEIP